MFETLPASLQLNSMPHFLAKTRTEMMSRCLGCNSLRKTMAPLTAVCTRRVSKSWNRLLWFGCVGGGRGNQTTLGAAFKFGRAVSRLPSPFVFHGPAVTRCPSEDSSRPSQSCIAPPGHFTCQCALARKLLPQDTQGVETPGPVLSCAASVPYLRDEPTHRMRGGTSVQAKRS